MLIDTHCHLDFERFDDDRGAVVARAAKSGVGRIIVPALEPDSWQTVLDLADRYDMVYAALGVHPNSSANWQDGWIDQLRQLAGQRKVVAIGEIGLDYYRDRSPKEIQQRAFAAQLELAAELGKPAIIHNREADVDVLRLLRESPLNGRENPGVLHSFSSSWPVAEAALAMGFYLGFTGPVTYPKADELRQVVKKTPMDRLLVETDAPFLAPQAHRGRRNEPAYVRLIAEQVAQIRGLRMGTVEAMTTDAAACLFGRDILRDT